MKERQQIRRHNLDQRKLGGKAGANLSRKRIGNEDGDADGDKNGEALNDKKRRRMGPHADKTRAGFEGKKKGFINKDKNSAGVQNDKAQ